MSHVRVGLAASSNDAMGERREPRVIERAVHDLSAQAVIDSPAPTSLRSMKYRALEE